MDYARRSSCKEEGGCGTYDYVNVGVGRVGVGVSILPFERRLLGIPPCVVPGVVELYCAVRSVVCGRRLSDARVSHVPLVAQGEHTGRSEMISSRLRSMLQVCGISRRCRDQPYVLRRQRGVVVQNLEECIAMRIERQELALRSMSAASGEASGTCRPEDSASEKRCARNTTGCTYLLKVLLEATIKSLLDPFIDADRLKVTLVRNATIGQAQVFHIQLFIRSDSDCLHPSCYALNCSVWQQHSWAQLKTSSLGKDG